MHSSGRFCQVEIGSEEPQQSKAKAVAQRHASPSTSKQKKEMKEVKGAWGHVVDALRSERPRPDHGRKF